MSCTTNPFPCVHSWLIYTYNHRLLDFYEKIYTNIFKRTETKMEAECHTNNLLQQLSTNCCRKDYDLQQFSYDSGCGYCYSTTDRKDRCPASFFYFDYGFNGQDGAELLNSLNPLTGSKTKTKKNPLVRMEGVALMLCFRLGLIRASS